MKKIYKLLLYIWIGEFVVISLLDERNIKIQSWVGNAIGALLFFLPVQILLFLLWHDEGVTKKKRLFFKIMFWFITICYLLGGISTLVFN